jgi:hypothetical protein
MKTITINKIKYKIKKVLQDSRDLKEFELEDFKGNKFLFQLVLDKIPSLWKINKKLIHEASSEDFSPENVIEVQEFTF